MKSFRWLFMRLRTLHEREDKLHKPKGDNRKPKEGNRGKPSTDHTGRDFPSFKAMCAAWGVEPGLVRDRINYMGWSLKNALTTPALKRSQWHPYPVNWYHPDIRDKIQQERDNRRAP